MSTTPELFTYTDPSDDTLTISRTNNVVVLEAQQGDKVAGIHVLIEDIDEVVGALRAASRVQPARPVPDTERDAVWAQAFADDAMKPRADRQGLIRVGQAVADEEQRDLRADRNNLRVMYDVSEARVNDLIEERDRLRAELKQARAAVYRELADQQTQLAVADDLARRRDVAAARRQLVRELRHLAAETAGSGGQAEDGAPVEPTAEMAASLRRDGFSDDEITAMFAVPTPVDQDDDRQTLAAALDGLHTLIATSSRDWQTYRVDAWIWAVICGWDCEETEHDETCTHGALEETAAMHGWDAATVAKARRYRAAVRRLTA